MTEKLSYTIEEAVEATGIPRTGLYESIGAGKLISRKYGRRTLILAEDLRAFLIALPLARNAPAE